jgi:penicillin-binding protein 2
LADRLGIDRIDKYAKEFGFGEKTGIDLPDEEPGLMPSAEWVLRNFHHKWYAGETISVGIGQGAIEVTPIQLARYISGVASDGHLVRPHVVAASELSPEFRKALLDTYPGAGDAYVPIDPQTWMIITDGMAQVTEPGAFHTAGSAHLNGIDFAGKTGTAEVISDAALSHMAHSRSTEPNVWFVGVTPRRNPELVVAVLWQHGEFSYYSARIASRIVAAYVDKQRRLAHNLPTPAAQAPVEVGAVWGVPPSSGKGAGAMAHIQGGHFFVDPNLGSEDTVAQNQSSAPVAQKAGSDSSALAAALPEELSAALPKIAGKKP